MKKTLLRRTLTIAVLATAAFFNGCSNEGDPTSSQQAGPVMHPNAQGGPAWTVRLKSTCNDRAVDSCVSAYGFTVAADRKYLVGPGPDGQLLDGALSEGEFAAVEQLVLKQLPLLNQEISPEACAPRTAQETDDSISLSSHGRDKTVVRAAQSEICALATTEDAALLQKTMKDLAARYYPTPFPSECINASIAMKDLYRDLRHCTTSSDCAYVDNAFQPIGHAEVQFVVTDDCTMMKPLVVANGSAAAASQLKLSMARENVRQVCGPQLTRINCARPTGFQAHSAAPMCVAGECRVSPDVVFY